MPTAVVLVLEQEGKHHSIQSKEFDAGEIGLRSDHDAILKHKVRRLGGDLVIWENVLLDRADDISIIKAAFGSFASALFAWDDPSLPLPFEAWRMASHLTANVFECAVLVRAIVYK